MRTPNSNPPSNRATGGHAITAVAVSVAIHIAIWMLSTFAKAHIPKNTAPATQFVDIRSVESIAPQPPAAPVESPPSVPKQPVKKEDLPPVAPPKQPRPKAIPKKRPRRRRTRKPVARKAQPQVPLSEPLSPDPVPTDTVSSTAPITSDIKMDNTESNATRGRSTKGGVGGGSGIPGRSRAPKRGTGFKRTFKKGEVAPRAVISKRAKVLKRVQPAYPASVTALGIEGRVTTRLTISETGAVIKAVVTKGLHPKLDAAAVAAAKKMRFAAATVDGKPVTTTITYKFTFVLD